MESQISRYLRDRSVYVRVAVSLLLFFHLPVFAQPVSSQPSEEFTVDGRTYSVRIILGAGEERAIEVTFRGQDDSGEWSNIYRQYSGICGETSFNFLGEHETNDFGVVTFMNPQPSGTKIEASTGIGRVVKQAFNRVC